MNYNGLNWDAECQMTLLSPENKITDLTSVDICICKGDLLQTANAPAKNQKDNNTTTKYHKKYHKMA